MFYERYLSLCEKSGDKPYSLPLKLGAKSNSIVDQWKKGSLPRSEMLQKIADYFDVSVGYLMGYEDEKKPALPKESELDSLLIRRLVQLSPEEQEKVDAFVQGLIASR